MAILEDNLMLHDFRLWKLLKPGQVFPQSNTYNKNHKGKSNKNFFPRQAVKEPFVNMFTENSAIFYWQNSM